MNLIELQKELNSLGVDKLSYSLSGGLPNECYCIDKEHGSWLVYYSERGGRSGLKKFKTESSACEHLLKVLSDDPTVFR